MTTTPTSGAFLRAFAHARMTAATRHVATVIASAISYDGSYRGAPYGHAAFTMSELEEITGLAARTIRAALADLAEIFGLVIIRRHHRRHFFRFTGVAADANGPAKAADPGEAAAGPAAAKVTGTPMPASPYMKKQGNNDCSKTVRISPGESVWHTPWAALIERLKRGTPAEGMDTQFLWNGFCGLNRRNGHDAVPLRFLVGFLKKYPAKRRGWTPPIPKPKPQATAWPAESVIGSTAGSGQAGPIELARPAPFENRHFHRSDLQTRIGGPAYEGRVKAMMARFACGRFQAELAVHGEAVRAGEIGR